MMKFTLTKVALASITIMLSACTDAQLLRGEKSVSRKLQRAMDNPARMGGRMGKSSSSSSSEDCHRESKIGAFYEGVKLTGENEVAPFVGVDFACGTADVTILADDITMCDGHTMYYACIDTDIEGFAPAAMHIHRANIFENGDIVVDFTPLIRPGHPDTFGCVEIESEGLFNALVEQPEIYYVNAHVGGTAPTILSAIRGQLVQKFSAPLENMQTVTPFDQVVEGATGMATVSFEAAGSMTCFDVTIDGFDPGFAHVHMADMGMNGPRIFNFTSTKVDTGRFFGCIPTVELEEGVTVEETVVMVLTNPEKYYFDFHLALTQPEVFTSIRGQF